MAVQPNQQFNMDLASQQSFVRFFKNLPEKLNTTIRFFNRSDYYTVHGSDALFAAKEIFKTTAVCKMLGADPYKVEGLILNKNHFEAFIRDLLLVKQYRVEVYVNQGGKNQNWMLEYKGSPGNLVQFEDILFNNNDIVVSVRVIAVKLGMEGKLRKVGLSCVDTDATSFSVCEFQDNDSFSILESLVVTLTPKECLLIQGEGSYEFQALKQLMERNGVMVTLRKKSAFSSDSVIQDLNTLIKFNEGQQQNSQSLSETNLHLAMSATSALIKYLDMTSDEGNLSQYTLHQIEQSRYLRLDAAAIKALNIEPQTTTLTGLTGGAPTSILTLLNKCRTPQGNRLLAQWVRQPLKDLSLIKERHDIVEVLVNDNDLRSALSNEHLRRIPDLQQLAKKLARKKATLQDCYKIYLCMSALPQIIELLNEASSITALKNMFTQPLKDLIEDMEKYQQLVEETIDLEAAGRGDFIVQAQFNENLKELKDSMDDIDETIKSQLGRAADDLSLEAGKTIKLESNPQFGYYFRITLKEEKILRGKKSYSVLDSNKGGVRFRSNRLTELNNDCAAIKQKYAEEQKKVVAEIIEIAATSCGTLKEIGEVLATLDVLTAFASAAVNANKAYVRPEMLPSEKGEFHLVEVRHPCLEMQEGIDYIANDVNLKRGESHFSIVTGPNMGGKSTYIRSVGVAALMAHIGSFVPCERATISLLDSILARVGADDSQSKGLSTFMTEMVETAAIMKTSTCNSLVLIDELGRGTSTYEGCGIAWSIAEYLAKEVQCYCIYATHFHEVTQLAEEIPAVKNQHVTALVDANKLTLLYKVKPGISDQSFGIHVAKMTNFPDHVIKFAKRKQADLEDYTGSEFEGSESPGKKRMIIKEAGALIDEFLEKCSKLDVSLAETEFQKEVASLKEELLSRRNPYVMTLLAGI